MKSTPWSDTILAHPPRKVSQPQSTIKVSRSSLPTNLKSQDPLFLSETTNKKRFYQDERKCASSSVELHAKNRDSGDNQMIHRLLREVE